MTHDNDTADEPTLFSAVITPYRSLSGAGFVIVMVLFGAVSFAAGIFFLTLGAWPVLGFFGLDVLLLYVAFRLNYREAAAYEEVRVTPTELLMRQVSRRGEVREWKLNPVWARLDRDVHEEFGLQHLFLVSHGKRLAIASFLGPKEKESFADALATALGAARRGVTRTVPDPSS
jgi:uncharacterized membrane protein